MHNNEAWPNVDVSAWAATKNNFHLYLQMLGKLRVALSPAQPNWMHTALRLSARGLTTGPVPSASNAFEASFDVFTSEIIVDRSDGQQRRIAVLPARPIAEVYGELQKALAALEASCAISPVPQELADVTPFDADSRARSYDAAAVQRWFQAATATANVFEEWRTHFFGRTGIQVWWGALDVALLLFSGKHVLAPTGRGYLMKYDLDAELMNVGLYYGDENTPPFFYGYIFPQPPGSESLAIAPPSASWSTALGEWVLPYDVVRTAKNPTYELFSFLDAMYAQCVSAAGWDAEAYRYVPPPRPKPQRPLQLGKIGGDAASGPPR